MSDLAGAACPHSGPFGIGPGEPATSAAKCARAVVSEGWAVSPTVSVFKKVF